MKKLLLTAIMSTIISMCAFAQSDSKKQFSWGVKAGANLAYAVASYDCKVKTSFYAGVVAELPLSKGLSFQPEIVYSRQGIRYEDSGNKIWQRINYLNVPLLAKIYLAKRLSLDVGPQFGFLLNGRNKIELRNGQTGTFSTTSAYKRFDFSFAMGLSFRVSDNLDVSVRYNFGLTDVLKRSYRSFVNSVTQVGVGYRF